MPEVGRRLGRRGRRVDLGATALCRRRRAPLMSCRRRAFSPDALARKNGDEGDAPLRADDAGHARTTGARACPARRAQGPRCGSSSSVKLEQTVETDPDIDPWSVLLFLGSPTQYSPRMGLSLLLGLTGARCHPPSPRCEGSCPACGAWLRHAVDNHNGRCLRARARCADAKSGVRQENRRRGPGDTRLNSEAQRMREGLEGVCY